MSNNMSNKWLITGARVLDPANDLDAVRDVLIQRTARSRVSESRIAPDGLPVVDASGLVLTPGFVDLHCHLREPGFEYKETIATGTRAAVHGGFTTVCSMANTDPVVDTPATVALHFAPGQGSRSRAGIPPCRRHARLWRHAPRGNGGFGRGGRRCVLRRRHADSRCPHDAPRPRIQSPREQACREPLRRPLACPRRRHARRT